MLNWENIWKEAAVIYFVVLSQNFAGMDEKTYDSHSLDRQSKIGLPEFEAGVLLTQLRSLIGKNS
jgi:hypothetical protein